MQVLFVFLQSDAETVHINYYVCFWYKIVYTLLGKPFGTLGKGQQEDSRADRNVWRGECAGIAYSDSVLLPSCIFCERVFSRLDNQKLKCIMIMPWCRPAYPSILVQKLASSMDVHMYFSKYGQRVSQKYRNARNQGNKLCPDKNRSRKEASASAKPAQMMCIVFGESVVQSLIQNDFSRCEQNKCVRVSVCPVLQCVCIIENVSSRAVLTRWMIEKCPSALFGLFWLIGGASTEKKIWPKFWKYGHRQIGVLTKVL